MQSVGVPSPADGRGRVIDWDKLRVFHAVAEAGERVTGITVDTDHGAWITGGEMVKFLYFFSLPFSGRLLK